MLEFKLLIWTLKYKRGSSYWMEGFKILVCSDDDIFNVNLEMAQDPTDEGI